jgi:hypothetical protein
MFKVCQLGQVQQRFAGMAIDWLAGIQAIA